MASRVETAAQGLGEVTKRLNEELAKLEERTLAGLLAAGLLVLRRSNAKVPREYGFLIGSGEARKTPEDENTVEVVYGAEYAAHVHENVEMKLQGQPRPSGLGEYWGPSGEAKFLEKAVDESVSDIVQVVAAHAEIKRGGAAGGGEGTA